MKTTTIWKQNEEEKDLLRMTDVEQKQAVKEIKQIANELLFRVYNRNSHLFTRHIWADREELKSRCISAAKKGLKDQYLTFSRFTIPTERVLQLVSDNLLQKDSLQQIYRWERYGIPKEFDFPIGEVIGEGIPAAGDYSDFIGFSNLHIRLGAPCYPGRIFSVMSAYPSPSDEEFKKIEDNVKNYLSSKETRARKSS